MRYKPEHKEATHRRIVESASKEFRTHGFEGVSIPRLMGTLGLTHGGFYAHFADRENLVAEASVAALNQSLDAMLAGLKSSGFPAVLDYYLSEEQRDHPESACMLPSLSAEMARRPASSRAAFTEKLAEVLAAMTEFMPGPTPVRKAEKVNFLFAAMVGAVSLARAASDPELSRDILRSTRGQLLQFINEAGD